MDERPKNPRGPITWLASRSKRFWLSVASVPVLYVVSYGPACWIVSRNVVGISVFRVLYYPIAMLSYWSELAGGTPRPIRKAIRESIYWYGNLFVPEDRMVWCGSLRGKHLAGPDIVDQWGNPIDQPIDEPLDEPIDESQ